MLDRVEIIGGLVIAAAGIVVGEYRARTARKETAEDRILERNGRQLDEFYAPILAKLERISAIGVARQDISEAIRDASLNPPVRGSIPRALTKSVSRTSHLRS